MVNEVQEQKVNGGRYFFVFSQVYSMYFICPLTVSIGNHKNSYHKIEEIGAVVEEKERHEYASPGTCGQTNISPLF